jgi:hypothetical protein
MTEAQGASALREAHQESQGLDNPDSALALSSPVTFESMGHFTFEGTRHAETRKLFNNFFN